MSDKLLSTQLESLRYHVASGLMRSMGIENPWDSFSTNSRLGKALAECFRLSPDRMKWAHPGTWLHDNTLSRYSPFLCHKLILDPKQILLVMGNDGYVLNYNRNSGILKVAVIFHRECASTEEATRYLELWEAF